MRCAEAIADVAKPGPQQTPDRIGRTRLFVEQNPFARVHVVETQDLSDPTQGATPKRTRTGKLQSIERGTPKHDRHMPGELLVDGFGQFLSLRFIAKFDVHVEQGQPLIRDPRPQRCQKRDQRCARFADSSMQQVIIDTTMGNPSATRYSNHHAGRLRREVLRDVVVDL